MTTNTIELTALCASFPSNLVDHAPELFTVFKDYAEVVRESAEDALSPRLYALVRLAAATAIPSPALARHALALARTRASEVDIAGAVNAACHLRSGAAIAYGRLVFKLMEDSGSAPPETGARSQIALDREYMTKLRKASPRPFDAMARLTTARQKNNVLAELDYELIAIAVATVTQCVYCLEMHGNKARKLGASDQQIADAVHIAICARYEATLCEWSDVSPDANQSLK